MSSSGPLSIDSLSTDSRAYDLRPDARMTDGMTTGFSRMRELRLAGASEGPAGLPAGSPTRGTV